MNLIVNAIKLGLRDLAVAKGIKSPRVLEKVNARGEVVIALILPKPDTVPPMREPETSSGG
jgi:hypothetical protein